MNTAYVLLVQWAPLGAILSAGSEEQKQRYARGLATGELRGAILDTEPSGGSDVAKIQARAIRDGDLYRLCGTKVFCTISVVANFIVVAAKTDPEKNARGISLFVVEKGTPDWWLARANTRSVDAECRPAR